MMKEKLLIVDDQGELRKMLRIAMGYGKYQLFEAEDGTAALAAAAKEKPDVVLLDVMMPGDYDGLEVCRRLRADPETSHAYIALVTALGDPASVAKGREAGANAYVVKPFRLSRLIEVIERRETVESPVTAYSE